MSWAMKKLHKTPRILGLILCLTAQPFLFAETPVTEPEHAAEAPAEAPPKSLEEALERLQLPGIKINTEAWSVDVDATVSLRHGLLELIACTKDSKEHESVIAVNAKPSHIHTALLLIGATPGNPAMRKIIGEGEEARFIDLPPRGGLVDVYLVIDTEDGKKEFPINQFIVKASDDFYQDPPKEDPDQKPEFYPTHTFMFTGSVLVEHGEDQPRQYVADYSGNVIALVTFGDELLSTPEIHDDANHALVWEVRSDKLPELDSPVILRLKPQRAPKPQDEGKAAED
jgi:hypothetical protein